MRNNNEGCIARVPYRLTALLFLSAIMTIAGYSPASSKEKTNLNACQLLTLEEVEATLGEKVKKRASSPRNMELQGGKIINSSCWYDAVSSGRSVGLNITFRPDAEYPKTLDEYIEVSKGEMGAADEEALKKAIAIQGIGDLAVWTKSFGVGGLNVYLKDYKIIIMTGTAESDLETAKSLAGKVIQKLS